MKCLYGLVRFMFSFFLPICVWDEPFSFWSGSQKNKGVGVFFHVFFAFYVIPNIFRKKCKNYFFLGGVSKCTLFYVFFAFYAICTIFRGEKKNQI